MSKGKLVWVLAVAVGGAVVASDWATAAPSMGGPATQPATTRPSRMGARKKGLVKPWSEMTTLTPQQQDQIAKIHEDGLEQKHKVDEKELDDITALLTPAQQAEVADIQGKAKASMKEKSAARRKAASATQAAK